MDSSRGFEFSDLTPDERFVVGVLLKVFANALAQPPPKARRRRSEVRQVPLSFPLITERMHFRATQAGYCTRPSLQLKWTSDWRYTAASADPSLRARQKALEDFLELVGMRDYVVEIHDTAPHVRITATAHEG